VHDVENWKEPAVGIRSKDTQEALSWHHALASSMVMPFWLGSSLRPEHPISEVMAQTAASSVGKSKFTPQHVYSYRMSLPYFEFLVAILNFCR
jgi:hypothetical protein